MNPSASCGGAGAAGDAGGYAASAVGVAITTVGSASVGIMARTPRTPKAARRDGVTVVLDIAHSSDLGGMFLTVTRPSFASVISRLPRSAKKQQDSNDNYRSPSYVVAHFRSLPQLRFSISRTAFASPAT
jgi:hypothetical protein